MNTAHARFRDRLAARWATRTRPCRRRVHPYIPQLEVLEPRLVFSGLTSLTSAFNRIGIYTDGATFSSSAGLDKDGDALSAHLLGSSVTWNTNTLDLGPANAADVVSTAGQTLSLPAGNDAALSFLALAVNGNQTSQTFTVTYTDNSTQVFHQSISDWFTPQGYPGEAVVVSMPYRNTFSGGRDNRTFHVYGYTLNLDTTRSVKSITLPGNGNVEVLAMDLIPEVRVTDAGGTYNGTPFPATGTVNGGSTLDGVGLTFTYHAGSSASGTPLSGPPTDAGTYTVVASFAGSTNSWAASSATLTFVIAKATPAVSVTDSGGIYNGSAYAATDAGVTGVGGITLASFGSSSLSYTYFQGTSALAGAPVHAGDYTVVAHYAGDTDYNAADSTPLPLSVTRAALTVTAADATKVYGAPLPGFTVSYNGLVSGDSANSLSGTLTFRTTATAASHVAGSPYAVTPGGLTSTDYTITFVDGHLAITPAPLTVSTDDASKVYGAPLPDFTVNYSGLVNGDSAASLGGALTFTTTATAASHVAGSPYPVTPGGITSADYRIAFADGHLTVVPADLTVTADDESETAGGPAPAFAASFRGFVNGDTVGSLSGTLTFTTTVAASGSASIVPAGLTSTDYEITFVPGRLTVTPGFVSSTIAPTTAAAGPANLGIGVALVSLSHDSAVGSVSLVNHVLGSTSLSGAFGLVILVNGGPQPLRSVGGAAAGPPPGPDPAPEESPGQAGALAIAVHSLVPSTDAAPSTAAALTARGGMDGWIFDDDEDEELDRLFAALGVLGLYQEKDLFGNLLEAPVRAEDPFGRWAHKTEDGDEAAVTTALWFILATVACEASVLASMDR